MKRCSPLAVAALAAACATPMVDEPLLPTIAGSHTQVVVVRAATAGSTRARVDAYERREGGWHRALPTLPAVVGRSGIVAADAKREGDGGTPAGVHAIESAFGHATTGATKLAYRQATAVDWWIDDARSPLYNTWVVTSPGGRPDVGAEALRRDDAQYEFALVLGWNRTPIEPGRGSAIFLHVWKSPDEPTSGCVALARDHVRALLTWLDAAHQPVVVIAGA